MRFTSNEWHREYLIAPGEQSIEWAEKSPYPDPADLLDGVYAPER